MGRNLRHPHAQDEPHAVFCVNYRDILESGWIIPSVFQARYGGRIQLRSFASDWKRPLAWVDKFGVVHGLNEFGVGSADGVVLLLGLAELEDATDELHVKLPMTPASTVFVTP